MLRFKPIAALMLAVLLAGSMRGVLIGALDIVLTNDDGYNSPGIVALNKALTSKGHRVLLVAPKNQQSGSGAAISLKIGGTLDVEKVRST